MMIASDNISQMKNWLNYTESDSGRGTAFISDARLISLNYALSGNRAPDLGLYFIDHEAREIIRLVASVRPSGFVRPIAQDMFVCLLIIYRARYLYTDKSAHSCLI